MAEIDRIARPGGKLIVRDDSSTDGEVENLLKSLRWEVHLAFSKNQEGILSARSHSGDPIHIQLLHDIYGHNFALYIVTIFLQSLVPL